MTERETGVQRIPAYGGLCWLCRQPARWGEKLPGRRHRVRLLCQHHADLVFGADDNEQTPS
ncbi:MAG: hypothetical protein ACRDRH_06895 [Pseudonocardia sp.]